MTNPLLEEYFSALDRIKQGTPLIVRKDARINNDSVSLEAGRKKGSIKKSRSQFEVLIAAIDDAATEQSRPKNDHSQRLRRAKETADELRIELDTARSRELSLLAELYDTKKRLAALTGENILPIRRRD